MRFERDNGGFEVVALNVADRVFGAIPDMLNRVVVRGVGRKMDPMTILQGLAYGHSRTDQSAFVPPSIFPHNDDLIPRIQTQGV